MDTDGSSLLSPQACFERIYDEQGVEAYAFVIGRTGDHDAAEDLLQEIFARVWLNIETLQDLRPKQRRAWILTVARNLVIDHRRKSAARAEAEQEHDRGLRDRLDRAADPARAAEQKEAVQLLDRAIRRLPEDLRTVVCMRYLSDMSSVEIGEALGLPAGTVRYRLWRARKEMAEEAEVRRRQGDSRSKSE